MTTTPEQTIEDAELAARLRNGDDRAFTGLIAAYDPALRRLARCYVSEPSVADEVVRATWLAVIDGIDGFDGPSLRAWAFRILLNIARDHDVRPKGRNRTGSDVVGRPRPRRWDNWSEHEVADRETMSVVAEAIKTLSPTQREVITLRDVEGWSGYEVSETLSLNEANQRVLLHRARLRVRAALESHFDRKQ